MGNGSSRSTEISKDDLDYLLKKTSITAKEIKHWHRIYMVSFTFKKKEHGFAEH